MLMLRLRNYLEIERVRVTQVKYTVSGFVQKNKDEFPAHLRGQ